MRRDHSSDPRCSYKRRFTSRGEASRHAQYMFITGRGPFTRVYECPWCFGYHRTKRGVS